jgi:hypothetical protein
MKTYTCDYGDLQVTYCIESDVDGNTAVIEKVDGVTDFELSFDKETLSDMKFICECDYSDRQFKHYMNTGENI